MDLKYFLAQFQYCYSVHKKIRNGQRRVFAGGSWRCVRDDKEHKGQVQCQGVLSPPPPSLLSSSQGSTPLCPIILCFTNKCS